jgi:hypothetical protein
MHSRHTCISLTATHWLVIWDHVSCVVTCIQSCNQVKLLDKMMHGLPHQPGQQVVLLSQVLAAEVNIGYEDMLNTQVRVLGKGGGGGGRRLRGHAQHTGEGRGRQGGVGCRVLCVEVNMRSTSGMETCWTRGCRVLCAEVNIGYEDMLNTQVRGGEGGEGGRRSEAQDTTVCYMWTPHGGLVVSQLMLEQHQPMRPVTVTCHDSSATHSNRSAVMPHTLGPQRRACERGCRGRGASTHNL